MTTLLRHRCPRCAERAIRAGWAKLSPECPTCALPLARQTVAAAMWIATWATVLTVNAVVVIGTVTGATTTLTTGVAVGAAVIVPALILGSAKVMVMNALYRWDRPDG